MNSDLCNVILSICENHSLLPDDLHEKSAKESIINLTVREQEITKELDTIFSSIAKKYKKFQFDHDNSYLLLRRILPREREMADMNQETTWYDNTDNLY